VLINITGGADMTLFEVDEAANRIREEVDPNANIIFGSTFNPDLSGKLRVSVVATGIETPQDITANSKPSSPFTLQAKKEFRAPIEPVTANNEVTPKANAFNSTNKPSIQTSQQPDIQSTAMFTSAKITEDDAFIAPLPVEVAIEENTFNHHPQGLANFGTTKEEQPRQYNNPTPQHHKGDAYNNSQQPSLGLFSRMASSVGFKAPTTEQAHGRQNPQQKEVAEQDTLVFEEDALDVPAFLRRKRQ
jgi:cell division protein FtsZ